MLTDELMREVRRLQVRTKRRVEGLFAGEYHTAFKGRGIEFADVREYEPGDDTRSIDWNVTARAGKPFIKRFIEERELTVMLAVDLSGSGAFGSAGKAKGRVAVELAAVLALAAAMNNDRAGLLIFTDRIELFLPPRKGRIHVLRLLRELLNFPVARPSPGPPPFWRRSPSGEGRGTTTDVAGAVSHLTRMLRKKALIFLISDFLAPAFERELRFAARKHELIAVSVADPRETELPKAGMIELADAETGEHVLIDSSSRRARDEYKRLAAVRDAELDRTFARARTDRIRVRTDRPFVREIERYFHLRERRR